MRESYQWAGSEDLEALDLEDALSELDLSEDDESYIDEGTGWSEDLELAEILRDALNEDYADASPEELDAALEDMYGAMSPAEAFSFSKALRQIDRDATRVLADPLVGQIVKSGLPAAGGIAGTALGGPAGTAVGSRLGTVAAQAIPSSKKSTASPMTTAPASAGSAAATRALVAMQQPQVLKCLLTLALGAEGRQAINGIPVGAVMTMLGSLFEQAAEDADQLRYAAEESSGSLEAGEVYPYSDRIAPAERAQALYDDLIASEDQCLIEETQR